MTEPLYRVTMRDGREFAGLTNAEVIPWISNENSTEWAMVTPMEYAKDCHPDNAKAKKEAWDKKK
jgi:hypothetical protein